MTPEPSKRGKHKSHPTSKARNRRQKAKKKAARDREAAQRNGDYRRGAAFQGDACSTRHW